MTEDGPGAILVGIDGSTSSLRAAAYAVGLARRQRCELVAVYVRESVPFLLPMADTSGTATATVVDAHDAVEQQLRDALEQNVPGLGVAMRLVVRLGEPYAELISVAEEVRADAVIVGRSTKFVHRVAGSLPVKLIRCRRWPVTVVP
ncbi:universal stress protein [Actinoplanes sp. TBRC 11911]|uniref:universal stress protein n=1 Tax=Actinoplanes sp. TBRC 11911 TaxID=2729386 RepID=UPI0028A20E41|nr:universal stress protein [Actinoplanes sp. TBRC 11911]